MQMMTWQRATRKHMTWKGRQITDGHLAHQIRGVTPSSVFGSGGMGPIVWCTNDAARQVPTAWVVLVFTARGRSPARAGSAARRHGHEPFGPQRADRRGRLLLRGHGDEEPLG